MKNLSKFLMLILMFVPMVQASSLMTRLQQNITFGENTNELYDMWSLQSNPMLMKKQFQGYKKAVALCVKTKTFLQNPEVQHYLEQTRFFASLVVFCERKLFVFLLIAIKLFEVVKPIIKMRLHTLNLKKLEVKDPEMYAIAKKMQKDLGLENVDIQYFYADFKLNKNGTTTAGFMQPSNYLFGKFCKCFNVVLCRTNKDFLGVRVLELRHELAHVEQVLTQTVNGRGCGLHQDSALYQNATIQSCNFIEWKLSEQNADVVACGDCSCALCLCMFAKDRTSFDSAKMTPEGYCVSSRGYLSPEEIFEYAQAAIRDGLPLCAEHAAQKDVELRLKEIQNMDLSAL